jgi:hypothetical protein
VHSCPKTTGEREKGAIKGLPFSFSPVGLLTSGCRGKRLTGCRVERNWSLLECAGTEEGKQVAFTLRLTIGLEKHDGEWVIVHEHHSQPLDRDTARIGPESH